MTVRIKNLPQGKLPLHEAHLHKASFIIPENLNDVGLFKLAKSITGLDYPVLFKEYGGRFSYNEYYTLRNELNEVLITFFSNGSGRFKGTTMCLMNGLCFESWSSHNPLTIDVIELIKFVKTSDGWFTSLDLAVNDYQRLIDWLELVYCADKTRFRDRLVLKMNKTKPPIFLRSESESIYFGSSKSRTQVLAYVKEDSAPVYPDNEDPEPGEKVNYLTKLSKFPWIRLETKLRGKAQCQHVADMILAGDKSIDEIAKGVLAYLLDFKEPGILSKFKRPSLRWWTQFCGTEKINPNPLKPEVEHDDTFDSIAF